MVRKPRRLFDPRLREAAYEILEEDEAGHPIGRLVRNVIVLLILLSVSASVLDTVPSIRERFGQLFLTVEHVCVWVFTIEYAARVWCSVEDRAGRYGDPLAGRLRYALTPMALIDLLAILPYWLAFIFPLDLVVLRTIRLLRLAKLARHSIALETLQIVIMNEGRALFAALGVLGVAMIVMATLLHNVEGEVQPEAFGSIPAAMWWAVVTLTTVGYGDAVPVTPLGRVLAGVAAIIGIGMFALPTAIIGAGFVHEVQKRTFTFTARMVARVPLFSHLRPAQLAELTALLHRRDLPPRYTVVRRGEHGNAMWFIDEGSVVVRTPKRRIVLASGSFFGELALLHGRPRAATVVTLTPCRLLELTASDFHRLLAGDEILRAAITEEAERRHALFQEDEPATGGEAPP